MLIVKDSMVLIHLAKITLLEKSCSYFKKVLIPELVQKEVLRKEHPDSVLIRELVDKGKIKVKNVANANLLKRANEFNILRGEAEAVALYWQDNADYLATDDDNVRKKALILDLKIIGTPSILLTLFRKNIIDKEKTIKSINKLREIGWFNNFILDTILTEVDKK